MEADTRYGHRAWDKRPGDGVDPTPVVLNPAETLYEVANQAPMPDVAPLPMRLTGLRHTQPTIEDVLNVAPTGGILMNDTPTRQDSGMQGTLRNSTGAW